MRRDHLIAAGVIAAAVVAYLRPALLGGDIFTPAALLYEFPPWQQFIPDYFETFYNNFVSDNALQFLQWQRYARDALRELTFPEWNPYVLAGTPFYANAQTALLSPFALPVWLLPFGWSLGAQAALKLGVAGLGAYFLGRELRLALWPALLGGIAYAFCAFEIVWLQHPHTNVAPMLPWAIWLTERTLRTGSWRAALWLAAPVAVAMLGGHPGTQAHLLFGVALYAVVRALTVGAPGRLVPVAAGGLLGVLAGAVALLPSVLQVDGSTGEAVRSGESFDLPAGALLTPFFPDWWGRPSAVELPVLPAAFPERTMFVGAIAVILALAALLSRWRWREKVPLAVLGGVALLVALGVDPLRWIVDHLPLVGDVRQPRLILLCQLALAILGAMGAHRLLHEPGGRRAAAAAVGVALAGGVAAVLVVGPGGDAVRATWEHFTDWDDQNPDEAVIRLTTVVWWLLLALGLAVAVALARWRAVAAIALLAALVAVDVTRFVNGYQPMGPEDRVFPPEPPVAGALRTAMGEGRMSAVGFVFPADTTMGYRLRDVRGYDPPDPPLRYTRLWQRAQPGPPSDGLNLMAWSDDARRVHDVLGARAIYVPTGELEGLRRVYAGGDGQVFLNPTAAPRALVPARVTAVPSERAALDAMLEPRFDPRREVVVEGARATAGAGEVEVAADEFSRVELRTTMDREGLVVLNESLRDGWSVTVDGREAEPVRTNSVFRGVHVPAGEHTVVWSYRTPGLLLGGLLSALAVAAWITGWWVLRRRRPRAAAPAA